MNRVQLNRILTAALIIIWSFAGYRMVRKDPTHEKTNLVLNEVGAFLLEENRNSLDTFQLIEVQRDPFLDVTLNKKLAQPKKEITRTKSKVKTPVTNIWPEIEYFGFVQKQDNKEPLVLLKIDDTLQRVRKGETINGFLITSIFSDSVFLKRGKVEKHFNKH